MADCSHQNQQETDSEDQNEENDTICYIKSLPLPALLQIMNKLSLRSLLRLSETSKQFNELVTDTQKMDERLTLSLNILEPYNHGAYPEGTNFEKVIISNMTTPSHQKRFYEISKNFAANIKELELLNCSCLPFNHYTDGETDEPSDSICMKTLERLVLYKCSTPLFNYFQKGCKIQLYELKMVGNTAYYEGMIGVVQTQKQLRSLEIRHPLTIRELKNILGMKHLNKLSFELQSDKSKGKKLNTVFGEVESNVEFLTLLKWNLELGITRDFIKIVFPKLKVLTIEFLQIFDYSTSLNQLDHLNSINVTIDTFFTPKTMTILASNKLKYLNLDFNDLEEWKNIVVKSPNIEHLVLHSNVVSSELLKVIVEGLSGLRRLEITARNNPTEVDANSLTIILSTCSNLEYLRVNTLVGFPADYQDVFQQFSAKLADIKYHFDYSKERRHTSFDNWCRKDEAKKRCKKFKDEWVKDYAEMMQHNF